MASTDGYTNNIYQHLVHNHKDVRQSAMRKLRSFITSKQSTVTEKDLAKVWHGLYYCFWMSDKTEIQQEFACTLASSMHLWEPRVALLYFKTFIDMIGKEWCKIDHLRLEKYMSLVRRMIEAMFIYIRIHQWDLKLLTSYIDILNVFMRNARSLQRGCIIHIIDIWLMSWIKSFTQDVLFNELDLGTEQRYDDNIDLEDIYYNMYMQRKKDRYGSKAQERTRLKRLSKRVGGEPLPYEYTKAWAREQKKLNPLRTKDGLRVHTNPLAYIANKKEKHDITEDTPDIPANIIKISQEYLEPTPTKQCIIILDLLFNMYKFINNDQALASSLSIHCQKQIEEILRRLVHDAECQVKGVENTVPEKKIDVLGLTLYLSLDDIISHLDAKSKHDDDDTALLSNMTRRQREEYLLQKQENIVTLQTPAKARRRYQLMAQSLRDYNVQLKGLQDEAQDGDDNDNDTMFNVDGEGEDFDPSMLFGGEGEDFDPSLLFGGEGEEGEFDLPPGEGEFDFPPGEGEFDLPPGEGEFDLPPGEGEFDFPPGEGEMFDMSGFEGEFGEGEMFDMSGFEGEFDSFEGDEGDEGLMYDFSDNDDDSLFPDFDDESAQWSVDEEDEEEPEPAVTKKGGKKSNVKVVESPAPKKGNNKQQQHKQQQKEEVAVPSPLPTNNKQTNKNKKNDEKVIVVQSPLPVSANGKKGVQQQQQQQQPQPPQHDQHAKSKQQPKQQQKQQQPQQIQVVSPVKQNNKRKNMTSSPQQPQQQQTKRSKK